MVYWGGVGAGSGDGDGSGDEMDTDSPPIEPPKSTSKTRPSSPRGSHGDKTLKLACAECRR